MHFTKLHRLLFVAAGMLLSFSNLSAQITYNSVADGNWNTPSTWDCNCTPVVSNINNTINIEHAINITVGLGSNLRAQANVNVGGILTIEQGVIVNIGLDGGLDVNSGVLEVMGTLNNNLGDLNINSGVLNIDGTLTNVSDMTSGTTATCNVRQNGTFDNQAIFNSNALFNIDLDGTFIEGGTWTQGNTCNLNGTYTESGSLTLSATMNLRPGAAIDNQGSIAITSTGTINCNIDFPNGGSVDIDGIFNVAAGTTFFNNGSVPISNSGTFNNDGDFSSGGTLTVGGVFNNNNGSNYGGGILIVNGTMNNDGNMTTSSLTVNSTGVLNNLAGSSLDNTGASTDIFGTVNNDGTTTCALTVHASGTFNNNAGAAFTQNSTLTINGTFDNAPGSNLILSSSNFRGSGTFIGNLIPGGFLLPGSTGTNIGTLTVDGTFTNTSLLRIQAGGTAPGASDRLNVSGTATLGGILQILIEPGYSPAAGDQITVLNAGNLAGTFATFSAPANWFVNYNLPNTGDVTISFGASLPVEFSDFDGHYDGRANQLYWQTLSEQNNKGFRVEHATEQKGFREIGFVHAGSSPGAAQNYTFTHTSPVAGVNYYRLRQEDISGAYTYSKVIAIRVNSKESFELFPNVGDGSNITLQATLEQDETALQISVTDAKAQVVLSTSIENMRGINQNKFDWSALPSGFYSVFITTRYSTKVMKLVIRR